ncbi:MAG: peptide chain release factor 1 [Legionellales bacterium]|nr:peptide chain release factor 1 [Legionellales bacterium]OUX67100.1 MAG: peptide chain release factor 1 [bacterium TMED178]|tara:strand:+ start:9841 stop:10929 length:1089 start_codon:yes stop_codon:yes gene_type:complete
MRTLSDSLSEKLTILKERHQHLLDEMNQPNLDPKIMIDKSKEAAKIEPVVSLYNELCDQYQIREDTTKLLDDPQMQTLAQEEILMIDQTIHDKIDAIMQALVPDDPDNDKNVYLEIRAGTGGDEAALFAQNLFDMYSHFADHNRWRIEPIQVASTGQGGIKEIVVLVSGKQVYAKLKFESGVHRVQRVPKTESQGRIHTSACTVAILPEVSDVTEVTINPADLRIDTYRSSGAGGQHVNTTDSAVRVTHIPSGVVVECQDERSQHKNKAKAMKLLQSKILQHERETQHQEQAQERKVQVGSGDRSERIRTYNFPQGRITDHRINLTLYKLNEILAGDLNELINALTVENKARLMTQLDVKDE